MFNFGKNNKGRHVQIRKDIWIMRNNFQLNWANKFVVEVFWINLISEVYLNTFINIIFHLIGQKKKLTETKLS